jgi:hypothetical protein
MGSRILRSSRQGVDESTEAERAAIARLRRPPELWGRWSVAIALLLVWIALTGGVVVLITSSR